MGITFKAEKFSFDAQRNGHCWPGALEKCFDLRARNLKVKASGPQVSNFPAPRNVNTAPLAFVAKIFRAPFYIGVQVSTVQGFGRIVIVAVQKTVGRYRSNRILL